MTTSIKIIQPDDWHVHFREDEMLRVVTKYSARINKRCIAMPNTSTPITSSNQAIKYKKLVNCNYLSVTQGKKGAFVIDKNQNVTHCPAFLKKVKDKVGAGDAFLSIISLCHFMKYDPHFSIYLSSLAAAKSVDTIGNKIPINKNEMLKVISHMIK